MDMMENDDRLLIQFFEENREEIEDRGFSKRVMRQIPKPSLWFNRIWTAFWSLAGVAFFIHADGFKWFKTFVTNLTGDLSGSFVSFYTSTSISPLYAYIGILTLIIVGCYNAVASEN
uniref:DUF5056 domain-containing protein n=1 Tax=Prevotella sp. GTC17259 TaxID=3236795 RepID=A0AB33J9W6_9BACT